MAATAGEVARISPSNRSRISNGTRLFLDGVPVDGRAALARRFRDHVDDLADQLGGDPTPAQLILIRNAATLATLNEIDQAKAASGEQVDDELYLKRIGMLLRLLQALGLRRKPADPVPDPATADPYADAVIARGA